MSSIELLLIWSVCNTVLTVLLFIYLYKHERKNYMIMWIIGWCLYFVNQSLVIAQLGGHEYGIALSIIENISGSASGVFFISTIRKFTGQKVNVVWIYVAAVFSISELIGNIFGIYYLSNDIPVQIFMALVFLHMGMIAIKMQLKYKYRINILGPVMILWAIHKLDYIVLYRSISFVFWDYFLSLVFQYVTAIGVMFTLFNYTKLDLINSEQARRESEEKYKVLFEKNNSVVLLIDVENGNIIDVNPTACDFYGYSKEELLHKSINDITSISEEEIDYGLSEISKGNKYEGQMQNRLANGEIRDVEVHAGMIRVGDKTYAYTLVHDITERKKSEEKLEYLAYYDTLTELPNRASLDSYLDVTINYAKTHNYIAAVMFLDFDRFKNINDTLGHHIGDLLLKSISQRLREICSPDKTIVRLGGDEFVVLMSKAKSGIEVEEFADMLIHRFEEPFTIGENHLYCTVSIGIGLYPTDGGTIEELLKNADAAMYEAKELGRNNYQFYSSKLKSSLHDNFYIANSLRTAFDKNEFFLCYQPKVEMKTCNIVGMEALVRWNHTKIGIIPPYKFIPIAEETGMIIPLGEWVLRTACMQTKAWRDSGLNDLTVAVNISGRQFEHSDLYKTVVDILEETGLEPQYLELEITESIAIKNMYKVNEVLGKLRKMGVQVAMDDFGTGYSSLSYITKIEIDTIKIDQSFIRDIAENPHNIQIAEAIINIAHSLDYKVTAEGVETLEHLNFLKKNNCDYVQGYYFSKPLPKEEFEKLLKTPVRWKTENYAG